jgi:glutamine synthetase adenylyltransferase
MQRQLLSAIDGKSGSGGYDALRVEYRKLLLVLVARDTVGDIDVEQTAAELADLAEATLGAAYELARAEVRPPDDVRLAIIGMGKCGGRELNYVSDVDVIFVGGDNLAGRCRAPAGRQVRSAGAHPCQPRRLLRAVGAHLGVPGSAQGPAGRR